MKYEIRHSKHKTIGLKYGAHIELVSNFELQAPNFKTLEVC